MPCPTVVLNTPVQRFQKKEKLTDPATIAHLENGEALFGLHRLLAAPAAPLVTGPQLLGRHEARQGHVHRPHPPGELHGEVHEGIEGVAAVAALGALELVGWMGKRAAEGGRGKGSSGGGGGDTRIRRNGERGRLPRCPVPQALEKTATGSCNRVIHARRYLHMFRSRVLHGLPIYRTYPTAEVPPEDPVDRRRLRQPVGRRGLDPLPLEAAVHHLVQEVPQKLVSILLSSGVFCCCLPSH